MRARCCAFILTVMDLPQIGAHCSLPSCNVLDFLPMVCQCKASFCSQHISPDLHGCRAVRPNNNTSAPSTLPLQRCAFEGCQKPSLPAYNETGCSVCHKSFCAECVSLAGTFVLCIHSPCPSHRHPETHNCPSQPIDAIPSKSQSSAVIQKSSRLRSAKPPTDPAKLLQWRKMEVMKMRHRAVCGDPKDKTASLPPDQRLHVKIHFQDADKVFWFRKVRDFQRLSAVQLFQSLKNVVAGRALDLLVNQLGLTFPESTQVRLALISGEYHHLTRLQPLNLCSISLDEGESISLQNDQLLASQIEDGSMVAICPVK